MSWRALPAAAGGARQRLRLRGGTALGFGNVSKPADLLVEGVESGGKCRHCTDIVVLHWSAVRCASAFSTHHATRSSGQHP
jgi:hypothetical protein